MRWIFFVAVGLFIAPSLLFAGAASEPLGIDSAINYALKQNRKLLQKAINAEASRYDIEAANADFELRWRPELSAGYSDGNEEHGVGLSTSKKFAYGTVITAGANTTEGYDETAGARLNKSRASIALEQPLFRRFGPLMNREPVVRADRGLLSARRNYELQKSDLVVEVVDLYETINRLEELIRIDGTFLKRMDDLYRITKAKEIVGRSTRIDTLRVELLRGQAAARLEAQRERRETAIRAFADLLGFKLDQTFELEPVPLMTVDLPKAEEAVRIALENRLDYAEVLQGASDADRQVAIARKGLLPDLSLLTRKQWTGEGDSASESRNLDEHEWFVGMTLATDFNRTAERAQLKRSVAERASSKETVKIVELSIARQVHSRFLTYRRSRKEMEIAEGNLKLASARLQLAKRLFELGRSDNLSVTDAEEAFLQSEAAHLEARSNAILAGYKLFRTMGTLLEAPTDLKPSVRWS